MTTEQLQKASREFVKRVRSESEQERNKRDLSTCSIDLESFRASTPSNQGHLKGSGRCRAARAPGRAGRLARSRLPLLAADARHVAPTKSLC